MGDSSDGLFHKIDEHDPKYKGFSAEKFEAHSMVLSHLHSFRFFAEEANLQIRPLIVVFKKRLTDLERYLADNKEEMKSYFANEGDVKPAEGCHMAFISDLMNACEFSALQLLYGYSQCIERVARSEMLEDLRSDVFALGMLDKQSQHPWIDLVRIATNYARHFEEWNVDLRKISLDKGNLSEVVKAVTNKQRKKNIEILLKVPQLQDEILNSSFFLGTHLVKELRLDHDHEGLLMYQAWLVEIQNNWYTTIAPGNALNKMLLPFMKFGFGKYSAVKRLVAKFD